MFRRFFNNIIETALNIQPGYVSTNHPFHKTELEHLGWLSSFSPCFPVNADSIKIINDPKIFYKTLLKRCGEAKHRITLASLYLGTGELEKVFVDTISQNLNFKEGDLKLSILFDYTRGSRCEINSRTMLLPLLRQKETNCEICLYHTPFLQGIKKKITPPRFNEIFGLQHMKLYIFDDYLIISGANLSNDYFTNRQDRYFEIKNKKLADFYDGLVSKVQEFSLKLDTNNKVGLNKNWSLLPYKSSRHQFAEKAGNLISNYILDSKADSLNSNELTNADTWVYPLVQMGQLGVEQDSIVTERILAQAPEGTKLFIATGYFNLTPRYSSTIVRNSVAECNVLMAHPDANGFQGAKGPAGGIPAAYSLIAHNFHRTLEKAGQDGRVTLQEYLRTGWTYHAKGLWPFCTNNHLNNTKICEAFLNLNKNYKLQQRIYKNDIELLTKYIENEDINEDNYLLLLQSCGHLIPDELPSARISLAQEAWQTFIKKKVELNVEYYNALLQCYVENQMTLSHKEFLSKMTCEPNEQTYNLLLECVSENGDINQAVEIVNIMKEKHLSANEPVFSSLILCHLRCGDLKSVQNILDTMRIAQMTPSSNTYTALLRGYAERKEIGLFNSFLTAASTREFNIKQIISVLYSICVSGNLELLPMVKKSWASKTDSRTFDSKLKNLCTHLIYLKKPLIAYELFKCFVEPEIGFTSESDTYGSILLHEMVKSKTPAKIIIKIADDLIRNNRNTFALFKATEIALQVPNVELSLFLLQALNDRKEVLRNHYFWPILIHEARLRGEEGIFDVFKIMTQYNVGIEPETLEVYSLQYINNFDPEIIVNRLKQFNLTVTDSLSPICVVLLFMGKIKQVAQLTSMYKVKLNGSKLIRPLVSNFIKSNEIQSTITILKNIQNKDSSEDWAGQFVSLIFSRSGAKINHEQIVNLLNVYKSNEIKISAIYSDKIDYFSNRIKEKDVKIKIQKILHSLDSTTEDTNNSHIPHPRNMNLEELECHLIELRNKNMETRGILRKLIQMHCRVGNVERVTELRDEFDNSGYNMSPGMKSGLLDVYIKSDQFEKAWNIYKEIKENHPTFVVDEFKIVDLSRMLTQNDKFEDAVKILKNESSARKIVGGNTMEHNCWKLLNCVAKSGNVSETNTMFNTLVDNGYCSANNVILGSLIRVHLCNEDKKNAVEEFVNCCTKYKNTPLMHELLCFLIKNESPSELIQKVVEGTSLVHGISKAQTSLLAALAETGMTKTLRKLFLELVTPISQSLLEQYCHRWYTQGKIDVLNNIILSAEGMTVIDLSIVYYNLMKIYSSNNDCDTALTVWNEMQEKNIFPSENIKKLIDSLLSNKKSVNKL